MADFTLPPLPSEYEDPWFEARANFDLAVKERLEGALSDESLKDTYVTFLDEAGNPLVGKHVLVTVNTTTNEIEDITVEAL